MSADVGYIIGIMERLAPERMAEGWDNPGLHLGTPSAKVKRILVALDPVEEVAREAVDRKADLLITHHPFFFEPIKTLREDHPAGRTAAILIRNGISLYCAHTNLDNARGGINDYLASLLGIGDLRALEQPERLRYEKIVVFVPVGYEDKVAMAMADAGAGWIGNYSHCTFRAKGTGTFMPREGTNPFIGERGSLERVEEYRLETIVPAELTRQVVKAMLDAHPYEEAAYDVYALNNGRSDIGPGRIGVLPEPVPLGEFVKRVKDSLDLEWVKCTGDLDRLVKTVALCGGSGGSLIDKAAAKGADVFVSGDIKHHDGLKCRQLGMALVDAGHHGTEKIATDIIKRHIEGHIKGTDMEVEIMKSETNTNPFILL